MILVGTSGWQYRDWKERFYPPGLPQREWLRFFSERFPTVEVNNSFYRLPTEETFGRWREVSANRFVVAVKASQYITHIRRLREAADAVEPFWSRARKLGPKLGPVLFQLPPRFGVDIELLRAFLGILPRDMRAAFEFRDDSWRTPEVHEALDRAGAASVLADRPGWRVPTVVTGGWSYIRFHQGRPFAPGYTREKLRRWADRIAGMDATDVYVYFNNDTGGAAVRDAATLIDLLEDTGLAVVRQQGSPSTRE
ncbi:MAG: DUF72 domain-containing protein [Actinomycetota bacterium]|nr:DUF72 domain-containing protein [Actinomycetota bacterium]